MPISSLMAMERFTSKDFEVIYRKMGDHRLMSPTDINLISYEVSSAIHRNDERTEQHYGDL